MVLPGDGSSPGYHRWRSAVPHPGSSFLRRVFYHCPICFRFLSGLSLPLGLPLQLSPLLQFHRQDVGFPPAATLLCLPLGCPPSGPLPPA